MSIDLNGFWQSWDVVSGNTAATNEYEFWKGMVMSTGQVLNNQFDFFTYHNTTRYEWFKALQGTYPEVWDEYTFYKNTNDARIFDFKTFYEYGGSYLVATPVTPTPTPSITPTITPSPTPSITPTNTPTPSPSPSPTGCTSPLISTTSLSAYYKLNNNLNGTVGPTPLSAPNGISYTTGKFGDANGAGLFNGTSNYLSSGIDSAFGGSGNNISVMLWVYQNSYIETFDVINYFNSTTNVGWRVRLVNDGIGTNLEVRIASTTLTVTYSIPQNTWTHVGFTYDNTAGGFRVYINGSLATTGGSAGMNTNGANNGLRIGARNTGSLTGSYYEGRMDDINIWQRALTAGEVATLSTNCPLT
jgi:hypothetical protein